MLTHTASGRVNQRRLHSYLIVIFVANKSRGKKKKKKTGFKFCENESAGRDILVVKAMPPVKDATMSKMFQTSNPRISRACTNVGPYEEAYIVNIPCRFVVQFQASFV